MLIYGGGGVEKFFLYVFFSSGDIWRFVGWGIFIFFFVLFSFGFFFSFCFRGFRI